MTITFLDIFAGVGGFRSGLEKAGFECLGYIENDKFARRSYEAIYNIKNEYTATDIQKVKYNFLPKADLWSFGFPCQDISIAGKRRGLNGKTRSSLLFQVFRLLQDLRETDRPEFLLIENVKHLIRSQNGWDFSRLQTSMDGLGYDAEWEVINSSQYLPQNRERLFVIGHLRSKPAKKIFPIGSPNKKATSNRIKILNDPKKTNFENTSRIYDPTGLAPTLTTMGGGGRQPKIAIPINSKETPDPRTTLYIKGEPFRIRKLTPLECWRLQGFTDEQFYRAKNAGISDTQLYKQAGNAVTVPVVYAIGKKIKQEVKK